MDLFVSASGDRLIRGKEPVEALQKTKNVTIVMPEGALNWPKW